MVLKPIQAMMGNKYIHSYNQVCLALIFNRQNVSKTTSNYVSHAGQTQLKACRVGKMVSES